MIKAEEALKIINDSVNSLSTQEVKLTEALERVLAEDIKADIDIPLLDNSAMDGYAVKSSDTLNISQAKPKILDVIEDLKAGYLASKKVGSNQAVRIMTGAPVPEGADGVIMVEVTKREGDNRVKIFKEVAPCENIRRKGEDIKKGECVIKKGTLLDAAHIGMLASLGRPKIKVIRRPEVAILATGDEVIDLDEELTPGKLRSSNSYTLYSQILRCGGIPKNLGIAKDNIGELEAKIREGLDSDLILTSGGVSVGDYDLVKPVLTKMGADIKFWKVAIRPGKPLVFGTIKNVPMFGLPGNPVSSMMGFEVFVRPAILKMLGRDDDSRKEVDAVLEEDIEKKKKGLRYFLRAETRWDNGTYLTRTTGPQGSGILKSMALANSLIILPEEGEGVKRGARVSVKFLW